MRSPPLRAVDGIDDMWVVSGLDVYGIFSWFQSVRTCLAAARMSGVPP